MGLFHFLKDYNQKWEERNEAIKAKALEREKELEESKAKLATRKALLEEKIAQNKKTNDPLKNVTIPKPHVMNIKVAGVTFENRQKTIEKIFKKQKPFDKVLNIEFVGVDFQGELAIEVHVNKHMVGYVPKTRISEFVKHKDFGYKIKTCNCREVFDDKDKFICYGLTIKIEFEK